MARPKEPIFRGGFATRPANRHFYLSELATGALSARKNVFLSAPTNAFRSSVLIHPWNKKTLRCYTSLL